MLREQAPQVPQVEPTIQPEPVDEEGKDLDRQKRLLELENMRIEMALKLKKLMDDHEEQANKPARDQAEKEVKDREGADLTNTFKGIKDAINQLTSSSIEGSNKAIDALKKPRRLIRENGKIVGIEPGDN
jgi:hypothetical protein